MLDWLNLAIDEATKYQTEGIYRSQNKIDLRVENTRKGENAGYQLLKLQYF